MPAYSFTLPTAGGQDFVSDEHLPLIVYFYPKDNTPGCTEEANGLRAAYPRLQALGAEVVGVSVDNVESHAAFAARHNWDPRDEPQEYSYLLLTPRRIQSWREANELAGRTIMRDGVWLT